MKTYLTYGFGIAAACFVWTMIEDLAGLHGAHYDIGQFTHYVTWIVVIGGLWLGIKSIRTASPDGSLTYGRGVGAGMAITCFYAIGSAITGAIFLAYINPNFGDVLLAEQTKRWEAKGMDSAQIEKAQQFMHFFFQPIPSAIYLFITSLLFGLILSLIIAAILKRAGDGSALPIEPPPI
jgi:hypothetical protein